MATRTKGFVNMTRILLILAAVAVLLGLAAPVALAAEPDQSSRSFVLSVDRDVDVPAGDHVDTLVVVRADATVEGSVDSIVVVDGTATLTAATAGSVVVMNGTADLQAGTHVTGDVRTYDGTVNRAADAVVAGSVRSFEANVAAFALLLIPLILVLFVGIGVAAIVVALLVAAFGARQVRHAESLISNETGTVLVAGLIGSFVLPLLAVLVTITIVGAPIGLGALLIVLPALAFLGWIVAAIWVGDWILGRSRRPARRAALRRRGRRGHRARARRHRPVRQRHRDAVRVRRPARDRVADPPPAHGHGRLGRPGPGAAQRELGDARLERRTPSDATLVGARSPARPRCRRASPRVRSRC